MVTELASYRRCLERIKTNWPAFLEKRKERLKQQEWHGVAAEKVAENILEDLFTTILDWTLSDIINQVHHADLVLTRLGIKHLIFEVKRPGTLAWNRRAIDSALDQARRYADEQKVKCIGVSDGVMLYAADIEHGGLQDRVFASLESSEIPEILWWLSVDGIYRLRRNPQDAAFNLLPPEKPIEAPPLPEGVDGALLHPKYKIPANCFAYVGNAGDPRTWKLPYMNMNGSIDIKRLPKAIQAIVSNYRGAHVKGSIPPAAIPDVLERLARAAEHLGKMPHQTGETAPVYQQLASALEQSGKLDGIIS